jgi:hypothetical protein
MDGHLTETRGGKKGRIVGLAYLRDNGSPILKSLRKFLIEVFQPLAPDAEALEPRRRQMALF